MNHYEQLLQVAKYLGVNPHGSGISLDRNLQGEWFVHNFYTQKQKLSVGKNCDNVLDVIELAYYNMCCKKKEEKKRNDG